MYCNDSQSLDSMKLAVDIPWVTKDRVYIHSNTAWGSEIMILIESKYRFCGNTVIFYNMKLSKNVTPLKRKGQVITD